jgi:hypothetical protein
MILLLTTIVLWALPMSMEAPAQLNDTDRIRIAEARRLFAQLGDDLWPGWSEAPFCILLVTPEREFLIGHPKPDNSFTMVGHDSLLAGDVYVRARVFDTGLLATFPIGGVSTIVIGQAQRTDASHSTRWTVTLLHEHFHQWQQSRPDYYPSVGALDLEDDDASGMWMLDYPFPYEDREVNERFEELCDLLHDAVRASSSGSARRKIDKYLQRREEFCESLDERDYKYFSFQVWQEGIARYTEYTLARRASASFRPTDQFKDLDDFVSFEADARETASHILTELRRMSLKRSKRSAFYPFGAAEGILLDRVSPGWRDRYFEEKFFVEAYFETAHD